MKKDNTILKAILAGIYIAIAGTVFLTILKDYNNKVLGSFIFSFALIVIVKRDYSLYTGKIGYLLPYESKGLSNIIKVVLGNIIGLTSAGLLIRFSGLNLGEVSTNILSMKLEYSVIETLILSIFCGMLMYTAVDGAKNIKDDIGKMIVVILSVVIFLLADFQHSIANMFYMVLGNIWTLKMFGYILVMLLGNAIGGITINLLHEAIRRRM